MLNNQDIEKLNHDLKRASKVIKLIRNETNEQKRYLIADLLIDELDRLSEDIEDLREQ